MVPSDSLNSATPTGMHGMSLAIKTTGTLSSLLPTAPFVERRINAPKHACKSIPDQNWLLETAFCSP